VVLKFMARERRQIGGQGGTDWLESLAHVPAQLNSTSPVQRVTRRMKSLVARYWY
jgi:hypothetical protein